MSKYVKKFSSASEAIGATGIYTPLTVTVYEGDDHKLLSYCKGEADVPCEIRGTSLEDLYVVEQGYTGTTGI